MVNRNLIRQLEDDDLAQQLALLVPPDQGEELLLEALELEQQEYIQGRIVDGRIVEINDEWALMDVGFKSEGTVNLDEWGPDEAPPKVGDIVKVLIEEMEDDLGAADDPYGMISLSKRKAEKIIQWEAMMESVAEGQVVTGLVIRKIKGGLLCDIGVNVFLPGSQVDIRRPGDIGDFIGRVIQAEVLKIDDTRRNIVISRRSLIERQREEDRTYLMKELEVGQIRMGIVKNIADFGAFVDLGGIDGLLHITDMAWERIGHPSEMVAIDQEIEVKVLHIDREKQKIALGLKQKDRNPWDNVATKYPVNSVHPGEVVNVMSYGAFVKLEPGIEGLVHISEMSWTKRVNHPSELVNIGDKIEVKILNVDTEGQQLSLGMKQTQANPWDDVLARYPEGTDVVGKVRNLTNYGAFIELEEGIDGLLHVSDMSWTRKISHPSERLEKGQQISCRVLSVDESRRRIALGLKQLDNDPWDSDIPDKYQPGQLVKGKVTKITNFGVFVGLEDGLEGLLHISELADHKVENPEEMVNVGDEIEVKVLRVDTDERKIGLSRKRVDWDEDRERAAAVEEGGGSASAATDSELKGGLGGGEGPLFPTGN
ncbi:MAG: 30S ribosomal protein S1 [Planctomycetaceae bacterium]|nr:MAG: 30S ribosomal protein S1 [Planctomycetaceae bacterium]